MAAVAIARHLGLEVYATASPGKHGVLAGRWAWTPAHIASSRDAEFAARFLAATGGAGVDMVLNSLAGELDRRLAAAAAAAAGRSSRWARPTSATPRQVAAGSSRRAVPGLLRR